MITHSIQFRILPVSEDETTTQHIAWAIATFRTVHHKSLFGLWRTETLAPPAAPKPEEEPLSCTYVSYWSAATVLKNKSTEIENLRICFLFLSYPASFTVAHLCSISLRLLKIKTFFLKKVSLLKTSIKNLNPNSIFFFFFCGCPYTTLQK